MMRVGRNTNGVNLPTGFSSTVIPTISASPNYDALDVAGGVIEFASVSFFPGRQARVETLVVTDKNGQSPSFTLFLFKSTPTGGTYADNGALTYGSGDLANYVGHIVVVAGDYAIPVAGSSQATLSGLGMVVDVADTSLFGLIIVNSTWNAGSTSDLRLTLSGERR